MTQDTTGFLVTIFGQKLSIYLFEINQCFQTNDHTTALDTSSITLTSYLYSSLTNHRYSINYPSNPQPGITGCLTYDPFTQKCAQCTQGRVLTTDRTSCLNSCEDETIFKGLDGYCGTKFFSSGIRDALIYDPGTGVVDFDYSIYGPPSR